MLGQSFFSSKIFFHYHSALFFWYFKLLIISLGQLSTFLSNFLWFFASKNTFLPFFHPKIFFCKKFFSAFFLINFHRFFKPSLIMIGRVNLDLLNFCYFLLKNVIFWFKKYDFCWFGPILLFASKIFFHYHFTLIFSDFLSYQPSL